ncbi:MAG: hypothetical protein MUD10_02290 [Candidatus Pacebacteria bacterium]|nr:hypothetical protein [Candidatus Paceibacterota bacterium]
MIQSLNIVPDEIASYSKEFYNDISKKTDAVRSDAGVKGSVWQSYAKNNIEIVQTHEGKFWGDGQHLYWKDNELAWNEIEIPKEVAITVHGIAMLNGDPVAIIDDWNPWYPYSAWRFINSVFDEKLRYENGIYAVNLKTGVFTYKFPGKDAVVSPGSDKAIFRRARGANHELILWDLKTDELRTMTVLTESESGSGISFEYAWSDDSKAIGIKGNELTMKSFQLLYLTDKKELIRTR